LIGEIGVTLYYLTALSLSADSTGHQRKLPQQNRSLLHRTQEFKDQFLPMVTGLGNMSAPVTANRLFMTALGTTENILIPQKLAEFGLSQSQALGIYGIYSGMVLPMIFFPMVFANSIAVMLLPSISRAKEEGRHRQILHAVHLSFFLCMLFGFCCAFFFYYGGPIMGTKIFENQAAGIYIRTLSWLCPFLFLSAAMSSILNGLGKTKDTFFLNLSGAVIRIGFIQFGVPRFGFRAFLLGVLLSQIILSLLAYLRVLKITGEAS
jgi:stage V sporulation protein B